MDEYPFKIEEPFKGAWIKVDDLYKFFIISVDEVEPAPPSSGFGGAFVRVKRINIYNKEKIRIQKWSAKRKTDGVYLFNAEKFDPTEDDYRKVVKKLWNTFLK
jgi:hypothetical protein